MIDLNQVPEIEKAAIVTEAVDRYAFDHLRDPQTPEDKKKAAVLVEFTGQMANFVQMQQALEQQQVSQIELEEEQAAALSEAKAAQATAATTHTALDVFVAEPVVEPTAPEPAPAPAPAEAEPTKVINKFDAELGHN